MSAIDITEFKSRLDPVSILDVIPENVITYFMSGFCNVLNAGVCLLYDIKRSDGKIIERLDALGDINFFNPVCRKYRFDFGYNCKCKKYDECKASRYFEGKLA